MKINCLLLFIFVHIISSLRCSSRFSAVNGALRTVGRVQAKTDEQSAMELARADKTTSELDSVLKQLPEDQKYELLVQSYAAQILERETASGGAGVKPMDRIFRLYGEMLQKNMAPTTRSCRALLDSAAKFCSCDVLGKALQLGKASGKLKAFGVTTAMLVDPLATAKQVLPGLDLPEDDRELEIVLASAAFALTVTYVALQAGSIVNQGLHNWGTLVFGVVVLAGALDVSLTRGNSLRKAAAGLDRLVLADAERESHCEGAAFLSGYMLGLPSYCYKPDVPEALRMLMDYRESMSVFKQQAARALTAPRPVSESDTDMVLTYFVEPEVGGDGDSPGLALGRVLVWMLAPVAAEQLRYGKTVVSDPRNVYRLLAVLDGQRGEAGVFPARVPAEGDDRDALVRWAYYEAVALCKQYGDLLEDVRDFLQTGTSSVGECSLLIEQVLRR